MARRFPCLISVAVVVILLGLGRPGHAELEYRLVAGSLIGGSDNPRSQPKDAPTQSDGFATVQGRVELIDTGRLSVQRLTYAILATSWARGSLGSSLTQTLGLSSDIQPSPQARITLSLGAMLAQLSMVDTVAANDPQTVGPRPAGDQWFVGANAGESLSWEFGGSWGFQQALEGLLYHPLNSGGASGNKGATLSLAMDNGWLRDRVGLRGRAGVMVASTSGQPNRSASLGELVLNWHHDWTPEFTHDVAAGVLLLNSDQVRASPAGSASVAWRSTGREIELLAARSAQSNIYVGTAYERNLVSLRTGLPLDRRELLRILALADFEHDATLAASEGTAGSANILILTLGLSWQPGNTFRYGLEYSIRDQRASATESSTSMFPTLRRQLAMFTIEMQYPSR